TALSKIATHRRHHDPVGETQGLQAEGLEQPGKVAVHVYIFAPGSNTGATRCWPPSASTGCPTMKQLSSERRNMSAPPKSSTGSPSRHTPTPAPRLSTASG